jgi:hypothetical protein
MWLVLTFIACVASADGGRCRNVEIAWEGTPHQCMLFGQAEAARWVSEHPGWKLRHGYRCVNGRPA